LEEAITVIRGLYAGERVTYQGAEVHLGYPREGRRLKIMLAATGPKMLELVGRVADGVILGTGVSEEYLRYTQQRIEQGAASVGRDLKRDGFLHVIWAPCSISDDGQAAREAVRAHVARQVKLGLPFQLKDEDQAILQKIRAEYDYYEHMAVGTKHAELVPDHIVERFALAGTPSDIREQVERVLGYGVSVDEVAIIPYAYDPTEKARIIRSFAQQVMPQVR
jgi:5,10-methylenetetrahydromethanopterin reductase